MQTQSNTNTNSNTSKIIIGAAAGLSAAAAIWFFFLRNSSSGGKLDLDGDDAVFASKQSATAFQKPSGAISSSDSKVQQQQQRESFHRTDGEVGATASATSSSLSAAAAASGGEDGGLILPPGMPDADGKVRFPHLKLSIQLENGWTTMEEINPGPSSAVIPLMHEAFAGKVPDERTPPGEIPAILLQCDDTQQRFNLQQAKYQALAGSIQEMMMMTQGRFRPTVVQDGQLQEPLGIFERTATVELKTPMFQLLVIFFFGMVDDIAYSFQLLANPQVVQKMKGDFLNMAKNIKISRESSDKPVSSITVPLKDNCGTVKVPATWNYRQKEQPCPEKIVAPENVIGYVYGPSIVHPEALVFVNKAPDTTSMNTLRETDLKATTTNSSSASDKTFHLTEYQWPEGERPKGTAEEEEERAKMMIMRGLPPLPEGPPNFKILKHPDHDVWMVTGPTFRGEGELDEAALAMAFAGLDMSSITSSVVSTSLNKSQRNLFRSEKYNFEMMVTRDGNLTEPKIGQEPVVMYLPIGGEGSALTQPMVTIRVGDPSTDPDCKTTLEEWAENVKAQSDASEGALADIKRQKIGDAEFLTFISKETPNPDEIPEEYKQQQPPEAFEERTAMMFVMLKGETSLMLRWEILSSKFAEHEELMIDTVKSVKMF